MEEIIIPHWSIGSALLFVCLLFLLVAAVLVLIESVRWLANAVKRGITATEALRVVIFFILVAVSAFPGFVYQKMNFCWVVTLLHLTDNPTYDMLSAGMAVQKTVIAYTLRTLSLAIMYAIAFFVIRKDRKRNQ